MASASFAAAATSPASSPLTLDPIPLASRPAPGASAAAATTRRRDVLLLEHRPHPASPAPPHPSSSAAAAGVAAAQAARRRRPSSSSSSHPARPRWQTALSVAAKNAVLLAVLVYLGDRAWRWSHPAPPPGDRAAALEGYAARVGEVEASLARAFRMMQVQLEAVDRKIDGEVGAARADLLALLEERRRALEGDLARLDARADELGGALDGLRRMEFLRKDEFERFWDEVKGTLGSGSETEVDLDRVRALAREIAMAEIDKHAADGIGRADYALASGGGRVVRHSEPYVAKRGGGFIGMFTGGNADPAQKMLQPSFGEPGQCFPLQGSSGFVEIKLRSGIIPEAFTLEHVSKAVAYDRSTAPKDCRVSGWYEETPGETQPSHASKMALLTEFTYDLENNNVQTFDVTAPDVGVINMVRLDFTSNHGSSLHTCVYRFRVHGHEPVSPGTAGSQA